MIVNPFLEHFGESKIEKYFQEVTPLFLLRTSGVVWVNLLGGKIVAYPEVLQLSNDEIGAHH